MAFTPATLSRSSSSHSAVLRASSGDRRSFVGNSIASSAAAAPFTGSSISAPAVAADVGLTPASGCDNVEEIDPRKAQVAL
jgi:hypothetical protein